MRRKVPFLGEERIARAEDTDAQAKKARGNVIDDLLGTQKNSSTWEDLVADDHSASATLPRTLSRPHAAPQKPAARANTVPVTPRPDFRRAVIEGSYSDQNLAFIEWLPINSGHGLRVNICGTLDQNLRGEWRRLIEESERSGIGQFEFNLTEAPSLTLTGLGMLLLFKEQKGSGRGDIKLCHCNKDIWQMLQWTGMDKYFTIQGVPTN